MNGINIAAIRAAGYEVDGAPAEVALLRDGDAWEDRMILLSGIVVAYEWGGYEEPLHLEIEQSAAQDRGLLPDPAWVVSADTWPYAMGEGLYYPVVLGCPGGGTISAVPAIFVESTVVGGANNYLLVAGHIVSATSVTVYDGSNSETLNILPGVDGQGRPVSLVDLSTAAVIAVDPALAYTTSWSSPGWPTQGDDTGAGSILQAVLQQSTLPVDFGAVASARDMLDGYKIGAFIQQPIGPLEWISSALLPLLPLSVLTGPSGWRVVPIPITPTRADCQGVLEAGDGRPAVVRVGAAKKVGRDEVVNDLALRYSLDTISNAPSATARVGSEGHPTTFSRLSEQLYGRRVYSAETVAVYDESTAYKVLLWRSAAFAFSRDAATYSASQAWAGTQPGLIWLSDSRLQVDVAAWVERVSLTSDGRTEMDLIWWRQ